MPPLANFVVSDSEGDNDNGAESGDRGGGGGDGYGDTVPTLLIVDGGSPGDAYDNDGGPPLPPVNSGSSGLGEYFAGSAGNNNAASGESRQRQILSAQAGLIVEVVSSTAAAAGGDGGGGGGGAGPPPSVELSTVDLPVVDLPPAVVASIVGEEVEKVEEEGEDGDGSFHSSGSFEAVEQRIDDDDDDDYDDNDAKRKRKTADNGNNNNNTLHKSKTPLRNVSSPDYQESAAVLKKKIKRPKSEIITKRAKSAMAKFGMGESLRGEEDEEEEEEDWRPTGNKGKNLTTGQRRKATRSNTADDALAPLLPRARRKLKEETSTYVAPFKSGISQDMQTSSEKSGSLRFDSGGNVGSAAGGELNASSFVIDLTRPVLSAQQKAEFAPYPATTSNPSTAEPQLPKNIPYPAGLPDLGSLVVGSTIPNTPSQPIEPVLPTMEPLEPAMQPLEPDTTHHLQPAITTSPLSSPPGSDPPFIMEEIVIQPRAAIKTTTKKRRAITAPAGTESDQGFGSVASEWRAAKGKAQAGRAHTSPTAELASTRAGSEEWEGVVQVTKGGNKPTKKRKKTTTAAKDPKYNLRKEEKEAESLKQPIGRQETNKRNRMARVIQDSDEEEAEDLGTEADCADSGADRAPTPPPLPQKAKRGANAAGKGPAKPKLSKKRPAPVELDLSPDEEEVVIPKKGRPRGNKQARKPTPKKLNVEDQDDGSNQEQTSIAGPADEPLVVVAATTTKKAKLNAGTKPKAKRASTTKAAVKEPELSADRVASEDEGSGVEEEEKKKKEEEDGRPPAVIETPLQPKVEVPAPVVRPPVVRKAPTQPYRRVGLSRNAKIEPLLKIRRQI